MGLRRINPQYKIRKVGRFWYLYHYSYETYAQIAVSSYWHVCMWLATGDSTYRQAGYILVPKFN